MKKGLDERIDEPILRWFGNTERIENNRNGKRVYHWGMYEKLRVSIAEKVKLTERMTG